MWLNPIMYSPESSSPNPVELRRKYELQYALKIDTWKWKWKLKHKQLQSERRYSLHVPENRQTTMELLAPLRIHSLRKTEDLFILQKKTMVVPYNSITDDLKMSEQIKSKREWNRGRNKLKLGALYGTFNFRDRIRGFPTIIACFGILSELCPSGSN